MSHEFLPLCQKASARGCDWGLESPCHLHSALMMVSHKYVAVTPRLMQVPTLEQSMYGHFVT